MKTKDKVLYKDENITVTKDESGVIHYGGRVDKNSKTWAELLPEGAKQAIRDAGGIAQ